MALSRSWFVESPQWWYKIDEAGIQSGPYVFDETGAAALIGTGSGGGASAEEIADAIDLILGQDITTPLRTKAAPYVYTGEQQLLSAGLVAAVGLTVPAGTTLAVIQNNGTQPVRFRFGASSPTTSVGQRLPAGGVLYLDVTEADLADVQFIRELDGPILDIQYFR